eukprot:GHVU01038802.1.p1 GENE.GHVU01038802.1~~GHVU01038802.1.p1  ORF type:complete len:103 (-),score=6.24 GHVU01038802.1:28-336(-)
MATIAGRGCFLPHSLTHSSVDRSFDGSYDVDDSTSSSFVDLWLHPRYIYIVDGSIIIEMVDRSFIIIIRSGWSTVIVVLVIKRHRLLKLEADRLLYEWRVRE